MESTTEQSLTQEELTETPVLYTATGWVAGTYQPSPDKFYQGALVTQDGQEIPAELFWRLRNQLKRKHPGYATQPDFFLEPAIWTVYPSTDPLRFRLVVRKPLQSESSEFAGVGAEPGEKRPLDSFRMVGEIESSADETVTICIRRNQKPRKGQEDDPEYQPFVLTLKGSLPALAVGQIWEVEGRRDGQMLVVIAGRPYQPRKEDLVWIETLHKQHSTAKKATGLAGYSSSMNSILFIGGLNALPRAIKQVCGISQFMVRTSEAIKTHFFCAIRAFTQLEFMRAEELIENYWYEVQRNLSLQMARDFILEHLERKIGLIAHSQHSVNA